MTTTRIRKAVLALAGAAILATGLVANVAAAAPAASPLAPASGVEQAREVPIDAIKFPDVEVTKVGETYDPGSNTTSYAFYIRNVGKVTATNVHIKSRYAQKGAFGGSVSDIEHYTVPSLPPGFVVPRSVKCSGPPASSSPDQHAQACVQGFMYAEPVQHEIVTTNNGLWIQGW